jgi:hypothetical protein
MDCDLEQRDDGLWHCKAECGRKPYPKKIRQKCGSAPDYHKCGKCGEELKRRQKLPEKLWWWWCKQCDAFVRECKQCNAKSPPRAAADPKRDAP